ncbi:hypothetical protein [Aliiroseovarius lamellibrachiae]|uniref:hypothetical protein n=1 Tax=Aliiroseovarius lamellibrachiae TaxID=1924933 RepID=UPI001BE04736|nr:hypothetical protein [Aliiroseovarius lamellibrachiae]MBT2129975.1 hypothetical protein [Aliiroseovarius lamellibrachiae]
MGPLGKALSALSTLLIFVCIGALAWWGMSTISTDPTIATSVEGIERGQGWMTGSAKVALVAAVGSFVSGFLSKRIKNGKTL